MTAAAHETDRRPPQDAPPAPAPDEAPALHQEYNPHKASDSTPPDEAQARGQVKRRRAPKKNLEEDVLSLGEGSAQESEWQALSNQFQRKIGAPAIERLADLWVVTPDALRCLGIGFDAGAYTFPMRNASGEIIGIRKRGYDDPTQKYAVDETTNGLFIPAGVEPAGAAIITESESDLVSGLTLNVQGIGRPGAHAPTAEVVDFFKGCLTACPCIVADNDLEGLKGAEALAQALVQAGVPCRVLTPPDGLKDLRVWKTRGGLTREALARAIHKQPIRWPEKDAPGFVRAPNRVLRRGLIKEIGRGPYCLACLIQSFYSPGNPLCPSRETLARLLGVKPGTVDRWKRALREAGILSWLRGRKGLSNAYRVDFGPVRKSKGGARRGRERLL